MNEYKVLDAILAGYRDTARLPAIDNRARANSFIVNVTAHIRAVFCDADRQCTLSRPCENPIANLFPAQRQELLYDIHSFEYEVTLSPGMGAPLLVIKRSLLQLESELPESNSYRDLFDDYNKLVCGDAELKIFICPNPSTGLGPAHLKAFNAVSKYIRGSLYLVALPHLGTWTPEVLLNTLAYKIYRKNLIGELELFPRMIP